MNGMMQLLTYAPMVQRPRLTCRGGLQPAPGGAQKMPTTPRKNRGRRTASPPVLPSLALLSPLPSLLSTARQQPSACPDHGRPRRACPPQAQDEHADADGEAIDQQPLVANVAEDPGREEHPQTQDKI